MGSALRADLLFLRVERRSAATPVRLDGHDAGDGLAVPRLNRRIDRGWFALPDRGEPIRHVMLHALFFREFSILLDRVGPLSDSIARQAKTVLHFEGSLCPQK